MKVSEILANSKPNYLPKARNLDCIWWHAGYLVVRFKGWPALYVYGPNVPEEKRDMLLKNPYPDALFSKWKEKYNWQHFKVEA